MHSGATEGEARGVVAGDELMPRTRMVSTRVVEVEAPPSAIWPWLVRMGPGRAAPPIARSRSSRSTRIV
jgi:hypothetical protein